jgi:hypothetical protein
MNPRHQTACSIVIYHLSLYMVAKSELIKGPHDSSSITEGSGWILVIVDWDSRATLHLKVLVH